MGCRWLFSSGPANAGKVANLLDRYVAALDRDPCLVVPNRGEVERVERDLLTRVPALLGGWIGTFDDLSATDRAPLRERDPAHAVTAVARRPACGRAGVARGLGASARFAGFGDALGDALAELEAALVEPEEVDGELGRLYRAYRAELERLGAVDRELLAGRAAAAVGGDFAAWSGAPVFVYGFEDLTGAQWALLEALAGRCEVVVSLPYEPGRPAFAALERIASDLARLSPGRPTSCLLRTGTTPRRWRTSSGCSSRIATSSRRRSRVRCASSRRRARVACSSWSARRSSVCSATGWRRPTSGSSCHPSTTCARRSRLPSVPWAFRTPSKDRGGSRALRSAVRCWRCCASPGSGADGRISTRFSVLRTRGFPVPGRLCGGPPARAGGVGPGGSRRRRCGCSADRSPRSNGSGEPAAGGRAHTLPSGMLQSAWGLERPPVDGRAEIDLRAEEAVVGVVRELAAWNALGGRRDRTRSSPRSSEPRVARAREPGRVVVLDLLRARTRRFRVVFVLGLEEGVLPRRSSEAPFLSDELRRRLETRAGRRLVRRIRSPATGTSSTRRAREPGGVSTSCARPPRRRDGRSSRARSTTRCGRASQRRRSSAGRGGGRCRRSPGSCIRRRPSASVSARSRCSPQSRRWLPDRSPPRPGGSRQIDRRSGGVLSADEARQSPGAAACCASRPGSRSPSSRRSATARRCGSSSGWSTRARSTPEIDPRLRGQVAHQALYRVLCGLAQALRGRDRRCGSARRGRRVPARVPAEAIAGQVRLELADVDLLELEGTAGRDLEHFVRQDSALGLPLVPRRFEVSFGTERAAPELQRGLDLDGFTVSGKIDRIDLDPYSARGIVQDYKSGAAPRPAGSSRSGVCRCLCTSWPSATSSESSRSAASTGRSRASARPEAWRPRAQATSPASRRSTTSTRRPSGAVSTPPSRWRATRSPGSGTATSTAIRARRRARPGAVAWPICRVARA